MDLDWKAELIPGCFFLTVEQTTAFYGRVVDVRCQGLLWVLTLNPEELGVQKEIHHTDIAALLSLGQFLEAKRCGWSTDLEDIARILTLPPD